VVLGASRVELCTSVRPFNTTVWDTYHHVVKVITVVPLALAEEDEEEDEDSEETDDTTNGSTDNGANVCSESVCV